MKGKQILCIILILCFILSGCSKSKVNETNATPREQSKDSENDSNSTPKGRYMEKSIPLPEGINADNILLTKKDNQPVIYCF